MRSKGHAPVFEVKLWVTKNFDAVLHQSKIVYSDGTRGQADIPIAVRPSGFGAATFTYRVENGRPIIENVEGLGGRGSW